MTSPAFSVTGLHQTYGESAPPVHGDQQPGTHPDLARRVAVVTGGSRGIGAAAARALADNAVIETDLASAASSWITGITLDVAGGKVML